MAEFSKILICSTGQTGDVLPFFSIAKELETQNIKVDFFVYSNLSPLIKQAGFNNVNSVPVDETVFNTCLTQLVNSADGETQRKAVLKYHKLNFKQRYKALKVIVPLYDLILVADKDHAALLWARYYNKKVITVSFNPFRKINSGGLASILYSSLFKPFILYIYNSSLLNFLPGINALYRKEDIVFAVADFLKKDKSSRVIGPLYAIYPGTNNEEINSFYKSCGSKTKVVVALGSYARYVNDAFLNGLIKELIDKGYAVVLLSRPFAFASPFFLPYTGFANLENVFAGADVIIHHAGHGTVVSTMMCEKPFISIPLFGVQNKIAKSLTALGLSPAPVNKVDVETGIVRALEEVRTNYNIYLQKIKSVKQELQSENANNTLINLIKERLK